MTDNSTALAGCLMILAALLANVVFWGVLIWAIATFVLPHLSFWH